MEKFCAHFRSDFLAPLQGSRKEEIATSIPPHSSQLVSFLKHPEVAYVQIRHNVQNPSKIQVYLQYVRR
jgi:hypothetical protein